MCGSSAPDTSRQDAVAAQSVALSAEQLAWAKQVYGDGAGDRAYASEAARRVGALQETNMGLQNGITQRFAGQLDKQFALEDRIRTSAEAYDTPERRAQAANRAVADVEQNISGQRQGTLRTLMRRGVNPASSQTAGLAAGLDVAGARAKAGAASAAQNQIETVGNARVMDAANLGRGNASGQATSAGLAASLGNQSVANAQAPIGIGLSGAGLMQSGFAGAQSGLSSAGNIYGNSSAIQQRANDQSSLWGAIGQIGGAYAASDKNTKKRINPKSPEESLTAIEELKVSDWTYKKGKGDEGRHTGPMAQDVQASLGDDAAPNGKMIDLISMNGHLVNATKALAKRVRDLESA